MPYKNLDEKRAHQRAYYRANKEKCKAYNKIHRKRRRMQQIAHYTWNQKFVNRYKSFMGCSWPSCEVRDPDMLVFHAPNGHETFKVSLMLNYSRRRLKREMRCCVILCANHHLKTHILQKRESNEDSSRVSQ